MLSDGRKGSAVGDLVERRNQLPQVSVGRTRRLSCHVDEEIPNDNQCPVICGGGIGAQVYRRKRFVLEEREGTVGGAGIAEPVELDGHRLRTVRVGPLLQRFCEIFVQDGRVRAYRLVKSCGWNDNGRFSGAPLSERRG